MEKLCRACGNSKPTTEFHKDRSKTDGFNAYCKACQIERQKAYAMRPPRHTAPEGMKRCTVCKETKPKSEFHNQKAQYDGLDRRCKACAARLHNNWRRKNLKKAAQRMRRERAEDPERFKDYDRKKSYGLKPGQYAAMLAAQNGRCAICDTDKPGGRGAFHVDHCHVVESVRGLLCHNCNIGLGHFHHDISILSRAVRYLTEGSGEG